MRTYTIFGLILIIMASLGGIGTRVQASTQAPAVRTIEFEGQAIDLTGDWGEAQACVIWEQADASACFRTEAEMEQHIAEVEQRLAASADPNSRAASSCSSWLYLYQHDGYKGRRLQFSDRGYWQNLTDYNFNDQLSSYKVGSCDVSLAEHINGGGFWYPGNTTAGAQESRMGAGSTNWNDRVSSIYIR